MIVSHLWRAHIPNAAIVVGDPQDLDVGYTVTVVDLLIL